MSTEIICQTRGVKVCKITEGKNTLNYTLESPEGVTKFSRFMDAFFAYLDAIGWKAPLG